MEHQSLLQRGKKDGLPTWCQTLRKEKFSEYNGLTGLFFSQEVVA